MQSLQRCGTVTCSVRATIISSCRITAWRRTTSSCRSSSSWPGRPASPWLPPTTPTTCAKRTPRCRASCCASRLARPFRTPTRWSSRPTSSTSRRRTRCTICSPWCRRPARIRPRSPSSATLILILGTPRFLITKPRTAWTIRRFLKSSAGRVWSAAMAPTCRRPTKTVCSMRSAWSRRWGTRTTTSSCGTTSTTPRARASRWARAVVPAQAALRPTASASPISTPSATT